MLYLVRCTSSSCVSYFSAIAYIIRAILLYRVLHAHVYNFVTFYMRMRIIAAAHISISGIPHIHSACARQGLALALGVPGPGTARASVTKSTAHTCLVTSETSCALLLLI